MLILLINGMILLNRNVKFSLWKCPFIWNIDLIFGLKCFLIYGGFFLLFSFRKSFVNVKMMKDYLLLILLLLLDTIEYLMLMYISKYWIKDYVKGCIGIVDIVIKSGQKRKHNLNIVASNRDLYIWLHIFPWFMCILFWIHFSFFIPSSSW